MDLLTARRPYPADVLGRPSKKAAQAAVRAHLAITREGDPLRAALSEQLRAEKSLGGQERRFAALATRELSRHQRVLDLAAKLAGYPPGDWALAEDRVLVRYVLWRRMFTGATWREIAPEVKLPGPLRPRSVLDPVLEKVASAPLEVDDAELGTGVDRAAVLHSFPKWLAERLGAQVGPDEVDALLAALNEEPDVFVRARPRGARDERVAELSAEGVDCEAVAWTPDGIRVRGPGMRVFETAPMKRGLLQVQEPGSQLIAELTRPGDRGGEAIEGARVADVCAGAGGKTLALADLVGERGRVVAADKSRKRLEDARRRVKEAGLRNVTFPSDPPLKEMDAVLIDAPCSGVGSLAREPEQKWKLNAAKVAEFAKTQRQLLEDVGGKLRPGAVLVYATCSLLREENEDVVESFVGAHPEFEVEPAAKVLDEGTAASVTSGPYLRVWPHRVHAGGFFAARLRKRA